MRERLKPILEEYPSFPPSHGNWQDELLPEKQRAPSEEMVSPGVVIFLIPLAPQMNSLSIDRYQMPFEGLLAQWGEERSRKERRECFSRDGEATYANPIESLGLSISAVIGNTRIALESLPDKARQELLSLTTELHSSLAETPEKVARAISYIRERAGDIFSRATHSQLPKNSFLAIQEAFSDLPANSRQVLRQVLQTSNVISDTIGRAVKRVNETAARSSFDLVEYVRAHPDFLKELQDTAGRTVWNKWMLMKWELSTVGGPRTLLLGGTLVGGAAVVLSCAPSAPTYAVETPTPQVEGTPTAEIVYATPTDVYNPKTQKMEEMTPEAKVELQEIIADFLVEAPKARVPSFVFSQGVPNNPEHTILYGDVAVPESTKVTDVIQDRGNNTFGITIPGHLFAYVADAGDASGNRDIRSFQIPTPDGTPGVDFFIVFDRSTNEVVFFDEKGGIIAHVPLLGPQSGRLVTDIAPTATSTSTSTATSTSELEPDTPAPPTADPTAKREKTRTPEPIKQLPELKVGSGGFVEADGTPVQLRGAAAIHFIFQEQSWLKYSWFSQDIRILKKNRANFLVVPFNLGNIDNEEYRTQLLNGLKDARSLGFRVALTANVYGSYKEGKNILPGPLHIPDNKWHEALLRFVSYPDVADAIKLNVDIFNPMEEPGFTSDSSQRDLNWDLTMNQYAPQAEGVCAEVNAAIGGDVKCAVSGAYYAKDPRGVSIKPNSIYQINIYYETPESFDILKQMVAADNSIFVGEMGYTTDPEALKWYRDIVIPYLKQHGISFAAWGAVRGGDSKNLINGANGNTTAIGQIIFDAFK